MARAIGFEPQATRMGKLSNHNRDPWKASLPQFLEDSYRKRKSGSSAKAQGGAIARGNRTAEANQEGW